MGIEWDESAIRKMTEQATKEAMSLASRVASNARCPEHHRTPKITVRNSRTGEFEMNPCCAKGRKAADDAVSRVSR